MLSNNLRIKSDITFEFHVSRQARVKYDFDTTLFTITGDLVIANFYQARLLAEKINKVRKAENNNKLVTAGQINALGLLHEIFHFLIRFYEEKINPAVFSRGLNHLYNTVGKEGINNTLLQFINDFPPMDVYSGRILPEDYLEGFTGNKSNKEIILEELLLLNLENENPAIVSLEELYSDKALAQKTRYIDILDEAEKFFITEKPIGNENLPLTQFLKKPIKTNPYNIDGQLDYILSNWGIYVSNRFYEKILGGKDLIHEDFRLFIPPGAGIKPTPPVPQYKFDSDFFERLRAKLARGEELTPDESQFYYAETEQFTEDIDWMPKVVMIAKNTYVWLDQLSKKYQREIRRLDQIPDEELDNLARWNFTALWLIGIWERSSASKKVKHLTGNPDAVSSAYSLYDYVIADGLGGEDAFNNLKGRCWHRGIRLSSDMVPNHTGIYSRWVTEKPHYFIQSDYPPYPGYTFNGPDLSDDERVQIRIEDKYYSRTDASVVFQRRDSYSGDTKYIYHGNDGTHMPWNDTAQLNLLLPEVRESLIQTIMHVARKTPIIRFDAAMTLAKKHFQRLWFPQPGTAGAVPSRSDHAMSRLAFDNAMPVEFWREVVDRINAEMPQTLLLAEAFWLMESYFVRTLGMHRVYNSAFMHMMMKEENNKYRELMKNTLEFNPEILKRYVNFMSNPDEETAVNQFGKGDKYFGVSVMLITMPGLPMFAHGQIEGFAEKYGMEYQRAYYNEFIDDNLVRRHEAEIFPLAQKRYLFSQVYNFELYDYTDNNGNTNENVFAYSNKSGGEKALTIYNNSYNETAGTIKYSVQKAAPSGSLYNNNISDALAVKNDPLFYYICREHRSGLEFLLNGKDLHDFGLYIPLNGYEYKVFLDFREVFDTYGSYRAVYDRLNGSGVKSVDNYIRELQLSSLHRCARELFSFETFDKFTDYCFSDTADENELKKEQLLNIIDSFLNEYNNISTIPADKELVFSTISDEITALKKLAELINKTVSKKPMPAWLKNAGLLAGIFNGNKNGKDILFPVLLFKNLSSGWVTNNGESGNVFEKMMLDDILYASLQLRFHPQDKIHDEIKLIKTLSLSENIYNSERVLLKQSFPDESKAIKKATAPAKRIRSRQEFFIEKVLDLNNVFNYLNINEYQGKRYYHKESFDNLINWIPVVSAIEAANKYLVQPINNSNAVLPDNKSASFEDDLIKVIKKDNDFFKNIRSISENSGYLVDKLITAAKPKSAIKSSAGKNAAEKKSKDDKNGTKAKEKKSTVVKKKRMRKKGKDE